MIKNEFSKNWQDLRINPAEATIVVRGLAPGSTYLWQIGCRSGALILLYIKWFCF